MRRECGSGKKAKKCCGRGVWRRRLLGMSNIYDTWAGFPATPSFVPSCGPGYHRNTVCAESALNGLNGSIAAAASIASIAYDAASEQADAMIDAATDAFIDCQSAALSSADPFAEFSACVDTFAAAEDSAREAEKVAKKAISDAFGDAVGQAKQDYLEAMADCCEPDVPEPPVEPEQD